MAKKYQSNKSSREDDFSRRRFLSKYRRRKDILQRATWDFDVAIRNLQDMHFELQGEIDRLKKVSKTLDRQFKKLDEDAAGLKKRTGPKKGSQGR